jgi:hypothetical protein
MGRIKYEDLSAPFDFVSVAAPFELSYRVSVSNQSGPHHTVRASAGHRARRSRFHRAQPFITRRADHSTTGATGRSQPATLAWNPCVSQ